MTIIETSVMAGLLVIDFNLTPEQAETLRKMSIPFVCVNHYKNQDCRYDERDPLTPQGAGKLTLPRQPLRRCVEGIERFVTVKGGSYFFLPGLKALEFLASAL
jgi:hypothetical protein